MVAGGGGGACDQPLTPTRVVLFTAQSPRGRTHPSTPGPASLDPSYFTFVVTSPGGKAFELTSPTLDAALEADLDITSSWDDYENECAAAHYR